MKKLALLTLLITLCIAGYSQSQRLVMLEHFTQASCGPCATYNPSIHNLLIANPDKLTSISYHTSWPGYDPMYLHNTVDPNARVANYNVSSVPHSVLDGNFFSGHPASWNINTVNQRYAVPSPFNLSVNQRLSATNDTLFVTMLIECTAPVSGPLSAYMGVVEKHIHFNSPPGSNGEKDFYNVLKKLLPTKTGISLPTPMAPGDYAIVESYWVLANVYTTSELSIVSFVQNPTTKEIHQAANLQLDPITAVYDKDLEQSSFVNLISGYCENTLQPKINIRNNGNDDITSLVFHYQVNDQPLQTYEWTGNLSFLDKEVIELPAFEFPILDTNTFKVYVHQVNQTTDEYAKNDTLVHNFYSAYKVGKSLQLKIRTDNAPEEVTWEILNSNGEVVANGGPYAVVNTMYTENILLENDDCYQFFIYDSGGNGLCCGNGTGFYRLATPNGNPVISQNTTFGNEVSAQFEVNTVGTNDINVNNQFKVYPNPASDRVKIEVPFDANNGKVRVTNKLGQMVYQGSLTGKSHEINTEKWANGLYIISIESASDIKVSKVTIQK